MKLFSKSDMATRWDMTRKNVWIREQRHEDFPPIHMTVDNGRMPLYLLKEVIKYEKKRGIAVKVWSFENYDVYEETDVLRFENKDGDVLGYVGNIHENRLIEELENGADPIADGWEDGVGNIINIDGWGNEE